LSFGNGSTKRDTLAGATLNAVSVMPSGCAMRLSKNSPSVTPETTSISRPSTSVERLYHHVVPGSNLSGSLLMRVTRRAAAGTCATDNGAYARSRRKYERVPPTQQ
jgi:hypothetical protein